MAIAHFSAGVSCMAILLLVSGRYSHHNAGLATFAGGFWNMVPDSHWVIPHEGISEIVYAVHGSRWADLFFFHFTMDQLDPGDTNSASAVYLAIMCVCLVALAYARHRHYRDDVSR